MFNALKYTEKLEKAGFGREQAETVVNVLIEIMEQNLATKQDLLNHQMATHQDFEVVHAEFKNVRAEMAQEFKLVRTEMAQEFKNVRAEMAQEFKNVRAEMAHEFKLVRTEMAQEFKNVRGEMALGFANVHNDMQKLEYRMTIKLGGMLAASIAIMATLNKIL